MRLSQYLWLALCAFASAARKPANTVLLSDVQTLTLRADKETSHRRVSAIPQLQCVGGNARGLYDVDVMRCKNSGSDYSSEEIQWTCQASLPPEFKLGSTDVICEGYSSPDDPYILKGSCGVEYRLVLTEAGEQKYGQRDDDSYGSGGGPTSGIFKAFFWLCFVLILGAIARSVWQSFTGRNQGPRLGGGPGGGFGGGFDDDNDPPPPYSRGPPPKSSYQQTPGRQANQQWRPGFWTGTAAGAAAGYAAGNMTAGRRTDPQVGSSRSAGSRSSSSSSQTPSTSRYESTGFGSTSRR